MEVQPKPRALRLLNVHRNEPGALSQINTIISKAGVNIEGQYLSTDDKIGYLMMDVQADNIVPLSEEISKLPISIKTRIV